MLGLHHRFWLNSGSSYTKLRCLQVCLTQGLFCPYAATAQDHNISTIITAGQCIIRKMQINRTRCSYSELQERISPEPSSSSFLTWHPAIPHISLQLHPLITAPRFLPRFNCLSNNSKRLQRKNCKSISS